jgi:hypothetical protein
VAGKAVEKKKVLRFVRLILLIIYTLVIRSPAAFLHLHSFFFFC